MANKSKFYVVWKGRQPGIYTNWDEAARQVNGFGGAEYKAFDSRQAAEQAFAGRYNDYKGKPAPRPRPLPVGAGAPVTPSVAVDAACSGNPGPLEFRGVDTGTGEVLFHQGPLHGGTNNVGEFLAIVQALQLLQRQNSPMPIYTDSENALIWVRKRKCRTSLARTAANKRVFHLIGEAERWLADNTYPNKLLKWLTEAWGEIPADFGRK